MTIIISGDTGVPVSPVTGTLAVANGGTGVTTSTGTGANVLGTSPTLTTPVFNSATFATVSGTAPLYGCRAWCVFNGATTGTNAPTAGGNVSTVTRNSTGSYTINFTTAMPDANYMVICGGGQANVLAVSGQNGGTYSTTQISVGTAVATTNAVYDSPYVNVAIFR